MSSRIYVLYTVNDTTELHQWPRQYYEKRKALGANVRHIGCVTAHDWVRKGRTHTTPLYIDNGKIRRAES